ncbi:MAG: Holliday junction resolvase RuvX [Candidatus Binataceae bacterium]
MAVASLDLGRRRIGVAIADPGGTGAYPIGAIERRSFARDAAAIVAMLRGRGVATIVVGLPLNMDGSEGPAARSARTFAARIAESLGVTVELFDERLTSFEARDRLRETRLRGTPPRKGAKKGVIDAIAAAVILEGWHAARAAQR